MTVVAWRRPGLVGLGLLCGVAWGGLLCRVGVHVTSDSASYFLSSLRLGWGQAAAISPSWPPLYPVVLWLLGGYPTHAAALLAGVSAAMLCVGVGLIAHQTTRSVLASAAAVVFCCVWGPVLFVFRYAWTEPLYAGLAILHIAAVTAHIRSKKLSHYALAAAAVSAAATTRYIGESMILVFGLYTLVHLIRQRAGWRAWGQHAAAALIPMLPLLLWLWSNHHATGHIHGPRKPSVTPLSENVRLLASSLSEQLWATPLMAAAVGGAVVLLVGLHWRERDRLGTRAGRYALAIAAAYCAALLYATSTVFIDQISYRFTAPLLPLLLATLVSAVGGAMTALPARSAAGLRWGLVALLATAALGNRPSVATALEPIRASATGGSGHELAGFDQSQTAAAVNALLVERLRDNHAYSAAVIVQHRSGHKSMGMWTRASILGRGGLSLTAFESYRKKNLRLALTLDGQPRTLNAWLHTTLSTPQHIAGELSDMLDQNNTDEVLVFTRRRLLQKLGVAGEDLANLGSEAIRCTADAPIDSYLVYTCRR